MGSNAAPSPAKGAAPQQGSGMGLGVGSGIGHAAAGAALGALSGGDDDGVGMEHYDDGSYAQQDAFNDANQHPCMRYWDQFQNCMNKNSEDISYCQNMYNVFNRCQMNPDGF